MFLSKNSLFLTLTSVTTEQYGLREFVQHLSVPVHDMVMS